MATTTSRPRKTVEDYLALPDDVRAELIAGELYVNAAPLPNHQTALLRLFRHLADFVEPRHLGAVWAAPVDVYLPSGDVVQPDLVYVSQARRDIVRDGIRGTPDLVVEVVSPSRPDRDRIVKRDLYARNEVPEYWIVEQPTDVMEAAIEVLCLDGGSWRAAGWFRPGNTLTSAALPGLALDVADVFRPAFE